MEKLTLEEYQKLTDQVIEAKEKFLALLEQWKHCVPITERQDGKRQDAIF